MDEVLLSSVVEACVRVGRPGLLAQKLRALRGDERTRVPVSGAHTFGSLIKAYGHAHDIEGAWACWKEMRSQHVKPTSITIGCMVEAVVTNGDVDGGYELIMQLLEDDHCKEQVNSVVFGSVLKGYARSKQMDRVWSVFQDMKSRSIQPTLVTYNAVVDACARNDRMDAVPELMQEVRRLDLRPNLITYSTLIKGYCLKGDMGSALSILDELRADGNVKPDEIVYNSLLDGCAQAGLVAEGERLFAEMEREGIRPSNYTLTVLVRILGHARRIERAFEVVDTVTRKGHFRANSHVCCALVNACLQGRDVQRAREVFEQMVRDRIPPDTKTTQALVRALLAANQTPQAAGLLRTALGLQGGHERAGQLQLEDGFLTEVLSSLAEKCGDGPAMAQRLHTDLRSAGHLGSQARNWRPRQHA